MEVRLSFMYDGAVTSTMQPTQMNNYDIVPVATEGMDPDIFKYFLQTCMKLLRNQNIVDGLQELIDSYASKEVPQNEIHVVNNLDKHKKGTRKEMRLTTQIGEYDMGQVILDIGSDANVLLKKTWELMGKLKLQWSTIQLKMMNQQKIVPLGILSSITIDIDGVCTTIDFGVIEILDDSNPYPAFV